MNYSHDPIADASRYYDRLDAQSDAMEKACQQVASEIHGTFAGMAGSQTLESLALPTTEWSGQKEAHMLISEAVAAIIQDEGQDGQIGPWDAFSALLRAKPEDAAKALGDLRTALANRYVYRWADEVAQLRVGEWQ